MPAEVASSLAALLSSDSPDWCTPSEVLDPVRTFATIRFDPFSNAGSIVGAAARAAELAREQLGNHSAEPIFREERPHAR